MAVVLLIKSVEGLPGKADRLGKATFRGVTYETKKVKNAKREVYFGESFDWPVARNVEPDETLTLEIFNHNTYLTNKLIGSLTVVLQQVVQDGMLHICDNLVDASHRLIDTTVNCEIKYYSPDGKVGQWEEVEFQYPLIEQWSQASEAGRAPSSLGDLSDRLQVNALDDGGSMGDTSSILSVGSMMMTGEDRLAHQAAVEAMFMAKQTRNELLETELHKSRDFQVNITIIEAQQLNGLNIDPVIKIEVGDDTKFTSIKQSTNCPYYNEFFVFDYNESPIMLFDKMITLTAYDATRLPGRTVLKAGNILAGSVIGSFKCDVGTVYASPDHTFFHKWAVLLQPKEIMEGAKGYIKCDLSVIGRGDAVKAQKPDKDEDNIEGNLLLPAGVPMERQSASYRVIIYRAEDLPRMDSGIMATVRKALTMTKVAFIDAYVKVSFVGHVGKTSVKKSYNPEWKEQLTFIDMFPPLCNRIKVQLCDSDAIKDEPIATHFIELPQIMDPGGDTEGILPTFGPSWINFYGGTRNYRVLDGHTDLNDGLGEGCAFRGRLLVQVKTDLLDADMASASTVYKDKVRAADKIEVAQRREFLLFCTILDASMIDKSHKDKQVYFEISIGTYGNTLDAKGETSLVTESSEDDSEEAEEAVMPLLKKKEKKPAPLQEEELPCNSTTEPMVPQSDDKCYYYLPFKEEKPCLSVMGWFEDLRKRLYHANLIVRMVEKMDEDLEDLRVTIRYDRPNQRAKLKRCLDDFVRGCDVYLRMAPNLETGAGSGKTKLDKYRLKSCLTRIESLKKEARVLKTGISRDNVRDRYREAKDILKQVKHLAKEPQHTLPDVFIWMIVNKKRVAFHRIPARDLIAAPQREQQGQHCGKVQTIFMKKAGKDAEGSNGWAIQAKLLAYLWLGQRDPKRKSKDYLKGIPEAYAETDQVKKASSTPPTSLTFEGEIHFQLRAYLYQARSLIGSDDSGLSDPFARVIFWNQCQQSRIVEATLSPMWDEVLVFEKIVMHGDPKVIAATPPIVIVEIFDYDAVGDPEFLGRCMARPKIKMADEPYSKPQFPSPLQWWDVYRGSSKAGELLASFELLEGDPTSFMALPAPKDNITKIKDKLQVIPIPQSIKPEVSRHRLEIMFWGVREPKRIQLLSVDRPRAEVEVAGVIKASKPIHSMNKNSNFEKTLDFVDLDLPVNPMYWPPLTIRVIDCRNFGREVLVGTATVSSLTSYVWKTPEERLQMRIAQMEKAAKKAEKEEEAKDGEKDTSKDMAGGSKAGSSKAGSKAPSMVGGLKNGGPRSALNGSIAGSVVPSGGGRATPIITSQPPSVLEQPGGPAIIIRQPSRTASRAPSRAGSIAPSNAMSLSPSRAVSRAPSRAASIAPSNAISLSPSRAISGAASLGPSIAIPTSPSRTQSRAPSVAPAMVGSMGAPLAVSSRAPSRAASRAPSVAGSRPPSVLGVPASSPPADEVPPADTADTAQNARKPGDVIINMDIISSAIPVSLDQMKLPTDKMPLFGKFLGGETKAEPESAADGNLGPDGQPLPPPGSPPLGPDGKPLPPATGPVGPDGQPLPPGVVAVGPDGKPLPPGVLGVGPDGQPLAPGVLPLDKDGNPLPPAYQAKAPDGTLLPPGVLAVGPDGKPLPPGVLGVGADGKPLPPGVPLLGPDGKPLPAGASPGGGGGGAAGGAAGQPGAEKKEPKNRRELIAELDWWSKYHVTMDDRELEEAAAKESDSEEELEDKDLSTADMDEAYKEEFRPLDFTGFNAEDITKIREMAAARDAGLGEDELAEKLRKKKKKKKKKKKRTKKQLLKKMRNIQGKFNEAFSKEEEEDDEYEPEVAEDRSHICRIKVFEGNLEDEPDFEGFTDWIHTFHLYRGKKVDDDEDDMLRVSGKFKGMFCLYRLDEEEESQEDVTHTHSIAMPRLKLMENLPSAKPMEMLVRVYVIKCYDLHPVDLNGKADPYLVIKCGRREKNDKDNKQNNTLMPIFGRMFELDVVFPMDSILKVQVMDYDALSADDLIGETVIDLENRYYSKYRGNCGISKCYELYGYNTWRDGMKPTQIVAKLCKDNKVDPPVYDRMGNATIGEYAYQAGKKIENDQGEMILTDELMAFEILQHWNDMLFGSPLVPEHIESRPLYNPEKPGVEQGRVEMWVDFFPKDQPVPSHTPDITPRKPIEYELRCIIWNTDDVVLEDTNPLTGEASSDIFIRSYLLGMGEDDQSTDIHYRSLDGEGNFNWRMVFPFDYMKAEEKVVFRKKESVFALEETEMRVPCKLTVQVWDADLVSADDFLGSVTLDLNRMPKPTKDSKKCSLKILEPDAPRFNLFKQKRCKGWYPMAAKTDEHGDDSDDDEDQPKGPKLVGKVEVELHLLTKDEAEKGPVGLGRDAPEPLPEPKRPDGSFLWFMNPLKTLRYIIWKNWKWLILKLALLLLLILFIALFIYAMPGATVNKIFNSG